MSYLKQMRGIGLFVILLATYLYKSPFFYKLIVVVLLLLFHKTSFIVSSIFVVVYECCAIYQSKNRYQYISSLRYKWIIVLGVFIGTMIIWYGYYTIHILNDVVTYIQSYSITQWAFGVFKKDTLLNQQSFFISLLLITIPFFRYVTTLNSRIFSKITTYRLSLLCIFIILTVWISFSWINFSKIIPYAIISLITLLYDSNYKVDNLINSILTITSLILSFFYCGYNIYRLSSQSSLISRDEIQSIASLSNYAKVTDVVMNDDKHKTPWIMWFSNRKRISPGMSYYYPARDKGMVFWEKRYTGNGYQQCALIKDNFGFLSGSIYLRLPYKKENTINTECFDIVNHQQWWIIAKYSP